MSAKELICGTKRFPINEISGMAIHGPASLVFTVGSDYYEIKPSNLSCTRKYFTSTTTSKKYTTERDNH